MIGSQSSLAQFLSKMAGIPSGPGDDSTLIYLMAEMIISKAIENDKRNCLTVNVKLET